MLLHLSVHTAKRTLPVLLINSEGSKTKKAYFSHMKLLLLIDSNRLKEGILLCEKQQYKDIVHDVLKINTS